MKGYKVFKSDWTCRGFQYEVGKTYEMDEEPEICENGFHFCTDLNDCFNYYNYDTNYKIAEVEALGETDKTDYDSKHCTNKIKIVKEMQWSKLNSIFKLREINDLKAKEVTILSSSDVEKYRDIIRKDCASSSFWLRDYKAYVEISYLELHFQTVSESYDVLSTSGVRPVLICDLSGLNLSIKDKFWYANHKWIVISEDMVLCDDIVGSSVFHIDDSSRVSIDYNRSFLRSWIKAWAKKNGITAKV